MILRMLEMSTNDIGSYPLAEPIRFINITHVGNDYSDGMSVRQLCEKYGKGFGTIRRWLALCNTKMRPVGPTRKITDITPLITDYLNGMCVQDIADKYNVSYDIARRSLLSVGIVLRVMRNR